MTKLKLGLGVLVIVSATAALVVQHQAQVKLRAENESLTQQIAQLKTDSESLSNRLAAAGNSRLLSDAQLHELLKLRGEVGVLRQRTKELGKLQEENHEGSAALARETESSSNSETLSPDDILGPGQMWFKNMPTYALLSSYAHFSGAEVEADDQVKNLPVVFSSDNTNAMTRAEAIRLLEQMFSDHGVEITHSETNRVIKIDRAIFQLRQP